MPSFKPDALGGPAHFKLHRASPPSPEAPEKAGSQIHMQSVSRRETAFPAAPSTAWTQRIAKPSSATAKQSTPEGANGPTNLKFLEKVKLSASAAGLGAIFGSIGLVGAVPQATMATASAQSILGGLVLGGVAGAIGAVSLLRALFPASSFTKP